MAILTPEFLQTKTYSAQRLRSVFLDMPLSEGTGLGGAMLVSQRASGGANMSVDVQAGGAFVKGDTSARQGLYHVYNDAILNLTIAANASGNPRIDQIICRVNDTIDGGAVSDNASIEVLQGTATSGATLANRTGAAALPSTAIRLADVLVASGAGSITDSNIRDRRSHISGAGCRISWNGTVGVATNTHAAFGNATGIAGPLAADPTVVYDTTAPTPGGSNGAMGRLAAEGRIVIPTTGIYAVSGYVTFAASATVGPRTVNLRRNTAAGSFGSIGHIAAQTADSVGATNSCSPNASSVYTFAEGDDLELTLYQNIGASLNLTGMWLSATLIAPVPAVI